MKWQWKGIGSVRVMQFLQDVGVLNMTEYLLAAHNRDEEEAQFILSDLFETDSELLANLVRHINHSDPLSLKINSVLYEGFRRLCYDILENPNELGKNYFLGLSELVSDECLETTRLIHLDIFLQMESHRNTVQQAIQNQKIWNESFDKECNTWQSFISSIVGDPMNRCKLLEKLLNFAFDERFQGWKNHLIFLRCAIMLPPCIQFVDEHTDTLNQFKSTTKRE